MRKATSRVQYMIKGNTVVKFDLTPCVNLNFLYSNEEKVGSFKINGEKNKTINYHDTLNSPDFIRLHIN